ncbi:DUF1428 domain-containing protein [Novosphingobium flavum]|uniref:DUF1428 domain-containing protein n=1 Tax=Novosphingobium flavum TaxID=1778672 RepID=A0A7X1FP18_9SPHN|nr:DUF1428 domain-containing protein [Novosphingobium flavum]MBC2664269.1 DUF1428 domain-containing protein [Novosphingobium flavum]
MSYIDGFVIAVPSANRDSFVEHARIFDTIIMEQGALRIVECWGDQVPDGKLTDFRRAVQATDEETVCFSWIEWPDKATRDAGHARMEAMMKDGTFAGADTQMPFDGKRMIYGGFAPVLELGGK